ncbi:YdcF family protein [soil metagenome]
MADAARTGGRRRLRLIVRVAVVVGSLLVLYVGVTFVQVATASRRDGAQPAQAIVVLGAAQYNGRPSPVLQARLDHALELYRDDLAEVIVVTGGRQEGDTFTEAGASYRYLREQGVPDEDLLREENGTNTWESLAAAARFLAERDIDDVLLVSSSYHSYRLADVADEVGLDAHVSPAGRELLSTRTELRQLVRETAAVSVGRIIGYRRLMRLDG